jgi:hypothetical protein
MFDRAGPRHGSGSPAGNAAAATVLVCRRLDAAQDAICELQVQQAASMEREQHLQQEVGWLVC